MTYLFLSICASKPQQCSEGVGGKLEHCSYGATVTLITDVALAAFLILTALLLVLVLHGVNLGPFNCLSSWGPTSVYALFGAGSALIVADLIALMIQMTSRLSKLTYQNHALRTSTAA